MKINTPITIGDTTVLPGETKKLNLSMPPLYTATEMSIPVFVKCGKRAGPTLFISAAIHGDELNGIEIVSRVINSRSIARLKGTLIAVPMVNVYGVLNQSRYLPDRRDLNRSFPGSKKGSLAGRLAHLFFNEVVLRSDFGIDLHTGAIHRSNLPQVRANLDDEEVRAMADAFGVPVMLNSDLRDGSLREAASDAGVRILLYEAGQALRYDEFSIRAGVKGIISTMRHLGMLNKSKGKEKVIKPFVARQSGWVRASESGLITHIAQLGDYVEKGSILAKIASPFGEILSTLVSPSDGVIIGKQNIPLAQEGEAIYHIAYFNKPDSVAEHVERFQDNIVPSEQTYDSNQ